MEQSTSSENEPWFVNSLARGISVLLAFSENREALRTTDVAEICGMSRAAARRFLMTLTALGYLRSTGNRFSLTAKMLDFGHAYLTSIGAVDLVQPLLEELTAACGETSSLAVLDDLDVVYLARTPTRRRITLRVGIGSRIPAYASSLGKAILAYLDQGEIDRILASLDFRQLTDQTITDVDRFKEVLETVRRNGYAVTVSELEYGVASIAVPILGYRGKVVAAVNVSTHTSGDDTDRLPRAFLPPLTKAKREIEAALKALPNFAAGLEY